MRLRPVLLGACLALAAQGSADQGAAGQSAAAQSAGAQPQNSHDCPEAAGSPGIPLAEIRLEGLKTTRGAVVLRELRHRAGEPFDCDRWAVERTKLEDLDVFAEVKARVDSGESGPVLVYAFRELPPYIPFVAMNKTDQDGFSAGPALASLNLFGWDIRAELITRFGGTTELQASFSSPWLGPLPVEYDLAVLHIDSWNAFESFHEDSWRVKLDLAHRVWEGGRPAAKGGWGGIAHILYAGELFFLEPDARAEASGERLLLSGNGDFVPRLGAGFLWDGRDRKHNPSRGWYQEVRATQNGGWLGGPADYAEWLADTRVYLPWLPRQTLVAAGLYQYRTGAIGSDFGRYDRFHAGGINTLRGYGNDSYRGKSEVILTLENRVDILRKRSFRLWKWGIYLGLQGLLGVEAASLWDHDALIEKELHPGVYAGAHVIIAGIDRIRLEIGSKTAKFQFWWDVGILEKPDIQRFRAR